MINVDKLINWGEVSRMLSGERSSLTRKRIPKKHKKKIDELRKFLKKWTEIIE